MAPPPITEDYYLVLEIEATATSEIITRSYRRLALKLHPDRNPSSDATEAFQLLGRAYETLKDESKRQAYNLIYPSIRRTSPTSQKSQPARGQNASTAQSETRADEAQIAALQKSKEERRARWQAKKSAIDSTIFEIQRHIRILEQDVTNLNSIAAAEAAAEAQKNSWSTWLLSPIYKQPEESEEEKARKDRQRQERRIERDLKERRLDAKRRDLSKEETLLKKAKEEINAAIKSDDKKIEQFQTRIRNRERQAREKEEQERQARFWKQQQERQAREREERERQAKIWKEQQEKQQAREREERERLNKIWRAQEEQYEKRAREIAEAIRKEQAEQQKRAEEQERKSQKIREDAIRKAREQRANYRTPGANTHYGASSGCIHDGWWPKVQGRTACPECSEIWTYLLECPECAMKACPKCQSDLRPKRRRSHARTHQARPSPYRAPSPIYDWD